MFFECTIEVPGTRPAQYPAGSEASAFGPLPLSDTLRCVDSKQVLASAAFELRHNCAVLRMWAMQQLQTVCLASSI